VLSGLEQVPSAEQKRSIVAETSSPGAKVCEVARRMDVVPMWSPGRPIGGVASFGPPHRELLAVTAKTRLWIQKMIVIK
jgi:hypothetical protein